MWQGRFLCGRFSVAGGNGSDTYGGADPERQKGTFGLMPGRRLGEKEEKSVPQPKTGSLRAVGYRPLKISSLRNGKAANLLK
jgi:hypothetical protein